MSPTSASLFGRKRRRGAMPEPTLDPKSLGEQSSRPIVLNHVKDRLTFLASGCHTVQRLMSLAKDHKYRLEQSHVRAN